MTIWRMSNWRYVSMYPSGTKTERQGKELLARSIFLLFKSGKKWTQSQRVRPEILFRKYQDLKKAYGLTHSPLRMIFSKNNVKDTARLAMGKWYNKAEEAGSIYFNVIAATFYEHNDDILNFYVNRASNAAAESLNARIKASEHRSELLWTKNSFSTDLI